MCGGGYESELSKDRIFIQIGNMICIYLVFDWILGIAKIVMSSFANNDVSIIELFRIIWNPISIFWYLYVLIIFYIGAVCLLSNKKNNVCIPAALTALILLSIFSDFVHVSIFEVQRVMRHAVYFYLGYVVCSKNYRFHFNQIVFSVCVAVILIRLFWRNDQRISSMPVIDTVCAILISCLLFGLFQNIRFLSVNKPLQFIGQFALEIYCFHVFFTAGCRVFLNRVGLDSPAICIVANFIISTTIPILLSKICKSLYVYDMIFRPCTYWIKHVQTRNQRGRNK